MNTTELHTAINNSLHSLASEVGLEHTMVLTDEGFVKALAFALTPRPTPYEFKDMCLELCDWLYSDADILKGGLALVKVTVWAPTSYKKGKITLCAANGVGKTWADGCAIQSYVID